MMNIAALMGAADALPEQNGNQAPAAGVDGDFKEMLQSLVTGVETQTQTAPATESAPNWLGVLFKLFDQELQISQTPDPSGEASEAGQTETTVSLTELMTVLQPLVDQSDLVVNGDVSALVAAQLPTGDQTENTVESDVTLLTQLSQLVTPTLAKPEASAAPADNQAPAKSTVVVTNGQHGTTAHLPLENQPVQTNNAANAQATVQSEQSVAAAAQNRAQFTALVEQQTQARPASQQNPAPATINQPSANKATPFAMAETEPAPAKSASAPQVQSASQANPAPQGTVPQTQAEFTLPQAQPATSAGSPASTAQPQPELQPNGEQPVPQAAPATATSVVQNVASTETTTVSAPKMADVPAMQQIVESVKLFTHHGETEVRLQLRPESLGQVLVQLHTTNGDVSVRMLAETAQAQSLIQDHLPQLKAAFAAQGLQVNSFNVDLGSNASAFNTSGQQSGSQQFHGENGYQFSRQNPANDQPSERHRPNVLDSMYSIDYQA